jgi:hypothetical protein
VPSKDEYEEMNKLYKSLSGSFANKTSQGTALEELAQLILKCIKGFYVTRKIRTGTNQFDCTVRNDYDIKCTVYNEIGSIIIAECKNEEGTPGNSYYHKLADIINSSKSKDERGFGILFSIGKIAKTCTTIAREKFLQNNMILINIFDKDLEEIVVSKRNFLVMLQEKIQTIKLDARTKPEDHSLYK